MPTARSAGMRTGALFLAISSVVLLATSTLNASPYSDINHAARAGPINVTPLRGGLAMMSGSGGNITALSGPQGFLLVDTGIAVSKPMIVAALRSIHPDRIRLAINTHWHWDHADGNAWVRASGADIMADPLAIARLMQTIRVSEWEHTFTPIPASALPNIAIRGDRTVRTNGETVRIRHYRPGHTDTDVSVYFVQANVLSVGDTFWNGQYPFIDHTTGGSIGGAIAAANANIAMANDKTIIVPGHGPVGDRASQIAFRDMLVAVRDRVAKLKRRGMTLTQVQHARPTASFDARWGRSIITGKLFTALVYRGV